MSSLVAIEGTRGAGMKEVFEQAMSQMDECDGVVILMQRKDSGVRWFAPDKMRLETMIFYLWSVLSQFGLMAAGKL
jgi:hypothetical protein